MRKSYGVNILILINCRNCVCLFLIKKVKPPQQVLFLLFFIFLTWFHCQMTASFFFYEEKLWCQNINFNKLQELCLFIPDQESEAFAISNILHFFFLLDSFCPLCKETGNEEPIFFGKLGDCLSHNDPFNH